MSTAAPSASAASNGSAKDWANGVCSAVQTFADSVDSTLSGLAGSTSIDDAAQHAKSGLEDATTQLDDSLQALGKPPTTDGGKARSAVKSLASELKIHVANVEALLSPLPSTPQEIASTFADLGDEVQKAVAQVKSTANTLDGLKPNGTLRKAFEKSSTCEKLKRSLHS